MQTIQSQKGQTLVEVVVAIAIIAIAFFGMIELGRASLRAADTAKGDLVGVNLAREGIELVRATRDNSSAEWTQISAMATNQVLYINPDLSNDIVVPGVNGTGADLYLNYGTEGIPTEESDTVPVSYVHSIASASCNPSDCIKTAYTREITVEYIRKGVDISNPYYLVTSKVTFTNRGRVRDIVLYEKLFDWRE